MLRGSRDTGLKRRFTLSYDFKEKDPTAFMRMPIAIPLTAAERDVLVKALEAYYFDGMMNERRIAVAYIGLRKKLLSQP